MISQLEEQLENKTNQHEEKLSEVMSLVNMLKNVETENSALKNDLATDRSVIDDLKIQNQQLENSLDQFKTMSSDEKIALQKKVTQLSCQLSSQTSVLDALNNDMSAKVEEIFILKETIEKMTVKTEADSSKLGRVMQENLTLLSETKENDEKMLKYQTDLDELTTKCNKLQNKLDEHEEKYKDQLKALNVEKDNCKNDLKEMMFKNKELQTDINSLREEYEMLKSKFADSEEQQKQAVLKIAEYQHAQRVFSDAAALADKQITQVRTELELQLREKKEELVRSQKLIENKDLKLEQYESELKELKLSNQQLQTEFDTRKNESEELEKLKTSHMEQIDELNEQLDMLEDSKKNMDGTNYALFLQIQDHEITIRDFQDEIESLKMGHKTETSDLCKKVNCLEEEVERLKEDLHEKIVLYNDAEFKLKEAEDSVETKSKEINHLSNETQALSVKYEDIKMEFENLKEERHQLSDGLQSMEDERRKFEEEEKRHQEEVELLEETISNKDQQLGKMREEITMMENVIADAESTQTQMTTQLKHLNDIIEQETAQHRKKVEDCETENETLLLEKQDLLQSLECLKIKQRLLDNDVKFRDNKICELEEQLNELGDKLSDAQEKSESWKMKCDGFKTRINVMEIDVTELECRLNEEREQCQQSETKFANAKSQIMEMQEALDCVREKLQTERTKVSDGDQTIIAAKIQFTDEKQQLETEIQDLQLQLSSSKEVLSATEKNFTNKMREMEAHCEKLRKQFELLHQQIHSLEESEKKLKNENVVLKQVCEETNTEAKAKLESVLDDMKQLKSDVEKSENEKQILVEELEKATSQNIEHDNRYWDEIESKNVSLQKQVEQMKAKVQLVTNNARRKEKELLQLQAKLHKMEQSNNLSYVETRSRSKPSLPPSESSSVPSNSSRSLHEGSNTGRRKSTRLSRKSGRKSVGKPVGNKTPPKKSKMTDEGSVSSSPQFSVEGLPHLVNQGFTNIPVGFSSPFVMRRQQLSHTTKLVAAAMAKKNGEAERAEDKRTMQLRSRKKASRSPSQLSVAEPLRQLTNSPKPPSTASSGGSQRANEDDPDCKVQ
uniref:Myosin-11 n=1 Tax=Phallusia mammillata TaxID=59560 RepID=A0A6F9DM92_9ASCI|nr:myosin-11 [Phallusia mammillata]